MWRWPVTLVVISVAALAVMPAVAAQGPTITASNEVFTPDRVTIAPGETVKFANAEGSHNFVFPDRAYPEIPTPANDSVWDDQSRTFTETGVYSFVCGAHPNMKGAIEVRDPAATPTPTPTPRTPTPAPSGSEGLEVRRLAMAGTTFCTRRCARPGVRVRIDLSQPAAVSGTLRRRGRGFGRVRFGTVQAGARTLSFRRNAAGRRLTAGRYTLRLRIAGEEQPALRFRVR